MHLRLIFCSLSDFFLLRFNINEIIPRTTVIPILVFTPKNRLAGYRNLGYFMYSCTYNANMHSLQSSLYANLSLKADHSDVCTCNLASLSNHVIATTAHQAHVLI